jgi:hypothetical protein
MPRNLKVFSRHTDAAAASLCYEVQVLVNFTTRTNGRAIFEISQECGANAGNELHNADRLPIYLDFLIIKFLEFTENVTTYARTNAL